jgi:hypothetical protein
MLLDEHPEIIDTFRSAVDVLKAQASAVQSPIPLLAPALPPPPQFVPQQLPAQPQLPQPQLLHPMHPAMQPVLSDNESGSERPNWGFASMEPEFLAQREREKRHEARGDEVYTDYFSNERNVLLLPEAPQPDKMKTKLLKHQLQGLKWMVEQEHPQLRTFGPDWQ